MYFIPADFASETQACASNFSGSKNMGRRLYSSTFSLRLWKTHSPSPSTLYTPQWMNMPNFMSWNSRRACRFSGEGW